MSNDSNTNYVTPDEARDRYIRYKSSIQRDHSNTSDLTIQSVSDTSHVNEELPSLPETPIKNKQLMSDDYVICNVKPRSTESQISSGESMESFCTTETDSCNDSEELSSAPLHKAVIILTDSYVIPQHILDKHLESKQPKHFPSNEIFGEMTTSSDILSVYADRSSEDIHSSEKECDALKLKLNSLNSQEI